MGILLIWTAVLVLATNSNAQSLGEAISGLAQNTTNLINDIIQNVNDSIRSIIAPIRAFVTNTTGRSRALFDSVKQVASSLQSLTSDQISQLTEDINSAVQNYVGNVTNNVNARTSELGNIVSSIFNRLSLVEPEILREEIDNVIENPSSKLRGLIIAVNLTCSEANTNVLDEVVEVLSEYPGDRSKINDLVDKVIKYCIVENVNNMTSDIQDKLQEMNKILQYIGVYLSNDGRDINFTLGSLKNEDSSEPEEDVEDIIDNVSDNVINSALSVIA